MGISAGEVATASDVRKLRMISENQSFTRVMSAASGDVAYTGYGFTPKALIAYAHTRAFSKQAINYGTFASTHGVILYSQDASRDGVTEFSSSLLFNLHDGVVASAGQFASVKSLDADGFTLTWNFGTGLSATADLSIIAFGDLL